MEAGARASSVLDVLPRNFHADTVRLVRGGHVLYAVITCCMCSGHVLYTVVTCSRVLLQIGITGTLLDTQGCGDSVIGCLAFKYVCQYPYCK